MAILYTKKVSPTSTSATTAQASYTTDNLSIQSVKQNYRASNNAATDIFLNFSAAKAVTGLLLQDVNFTTATIYQTTDGTTYTLVGTMTAYQDKKIPDRRRGIIPLAATVKGIKISIAAATPADGLVYWRIGTAYVFTGSIAFPSQPTYGAHVKSRRPLVTNEPSNGNRAVASAGAQFNEIALPFIPQATENFQTIISALQNTVCGLDMQLNGMQEMVWPVSQKEAEIDESFDDFNRTKIQLNLMEAV